MSSLGHFWLERKHFHSRYNIWRYGGRLVHPVERRINDCQLWQKSDRQDLGQHIKPTSLPLRIISLRRQLSHNVCLMELPKEQLPGFRIHWSTHLGHRKGNFLALNKETRQQKSPWRILHYICVLEQISSQYLSVCQRKRAYCSLGHQVQQVYFWIQGQSFVKCWKQKCQYLLE